MSDTEKNDSNGNKEVNGKSDLSGSQVNADAPNISKELQKEPPDEYLCPITHGLMQEPVVAKDGRTYEKAALLQWFRRSDRSPTNGLKLTTMDVTPNLNIKNLIQDFLQQNPHYQTSDSSFASSQGLFANVQAEDTVSCCKTGGSEQGERSRCNIL